MAKVEDYEKLGAFYLGKEYDHRQGDVTDDLLLYDAKDLTTHAVCVGMTGSGKTGLCVTLLEEAVIDGIPALVVDMKGDLVNLLLSFPKLRAADFEPWVDPDEARRKGKSVPDYAKDRAELWKKGIGSWGQDGKRIQRYRDAAEFTVYTPGSNAGRPLTVIKSFAAPAPELIDDADAFRDRINATVAGLLTLMGIDADPVRSREHILLSNILDRAWRDGQDLDLGSLIQQIQSPPFARIGFFDLETFFPAGDRLELAMSLNNLLASPGFSSWMEGDPLDIQRLLWTPSGKPRVSILSIAHLSDTERMFFMTVLLNEVAAWMRGQPGTSSLRALLYIDEVFGYLPPTANPPSKKPLLTLLKQARAFGVGVVLATQNPVDIDYKALSNSGTWFIGRLQTERDKMRVIEGLEGAAAASGAGFDRGEMETMISGLDSRVFVMNNVHDDEPVLFHTRWALNYLRGPMTRAHIRQLTATLGETEGGRVAAARAPTTPKKSEAKRAARAAVSERPVIPSDVPQAFMRLKPGRFDENELVYRPGIAARASLHYVAARQHLDRWEDLSAVAPLTDENLADPWDDAMLLAATDFDEEPEEGVRFADLPGVAMKARTLKSWGTRLKSHVYRERPMTLWKCPAFKATSKPGEEEGDFRARMRDLAREKRDVAVEKLRKRYASKLTTLKDRIRRAEDKVEREEAQYTSSKTQTAISFGASILGALFGRKVASRGNVGRAASVARGASRSMREKGDIERAEDALEVAQQKYRDLEAEFEEDLACLEDKTSVDDLEIVEKPIRPRKSDITVTDVTVVWMPWRMTANGLAEPAFEWE